MEAFLSFSQKELHQRVLAQYEFHKSKFIHLALAIYLITFISSEIPLLAINYDSTIDLPLYQYILRLVFILITLSIMVMLHGDYINNIYWDGVKVVVFTGILFTTSFNFSEPREVRSQFYGIAPFWEGLDVAFYLVIVSVFILRHRVTRCIFIGVNFAIAMGAKCQSAWDLFYVIKLFGILTALSLFMYSLERDFKTVYLRKLHYKQEEQAWRMLIDALPEGVLVLNTDEELMFCNKGIADFVKNDGKEPFKTSLSKLLQETHQLKFRDPLQSNQFDSFIVNSGLKNPKNAEGLILTTKEENGNSKRGFLGDDREETTYSSTLLDQLYFFLHHYQECKNRSIGWDLQKGEINFLTFEGRYKDKILEVKVGLSPFDYQDSILIILRDISDRNTIAALEANDKYKSLVLASVSHELRTPLNNIFNMVTFSTEATETPSNIKSQFLQPALVSTKMLLGLVNDILDYSQINANKFRLVYQDVDIKKVLEETCGLMQLQAERKELKLFVEISENLPNPFHTDPNRFTQIILNLLSNSLKFTLKGYIAVKAKVMDEEGLVEISVQDTGIGMSPEDQKQLFKDFTKINVEGNAKLNASGCGLGLSISNTLAKALARGEQDAIKVSSEKGIGSVFTFVLQNKAKEFQAKRKVVPKEEIKSPKPSHEKHLGGGKKLSGDFFPMNFDEVVAKKSEDHQALKKSIVEYYRTSMDVSNPLINTSSFGGISDGKKKIIEKPEILVVDDDPFNVLTLETILKSLQYPHCHAYNGKDAIDVLLKKNQNKSSDNIPLIFIDCNMPIMDGFEATKKIKEKIKAGELVNTMVIGCTGYDQEEYIKMCLDNGMDSVTTKPITKNKVDELLRKFLTKEDTPEITLM